MRGAGNIQWAKKLVALLWKVTGGGDFFVKNLPLDQFDFNSKESLGASVSKLKNLGWLSNIGRGQYDFTEKAKSLTCSVPETPDLPVPEERAVSDVLVLSPGEHQAFLSLNHCNPRDIGMAEHEKDRISEETVDTSGLDEDEKEAFFKKMLSLDIFLEIGPGKKGRVIHFSLEKYLELCDNVCVLSPVGKKLESLRLALAEKEKNLAEKREREESLGAELFRLAEDMDQMEKQLAELQRSINNKKRAQDILKADFEEIRQAIAELGREAEIEGLQQEIAFFESLAAMNESRRAKVLGEVCPKLP